MATFVFPESWTNVIISIFHQRLRQFTSVFELVCTGTRVRTPRWPGWKVGSWRAKKPKWGHRFWIDQLAKNANALIDIHGKPVVQGRYSNIVGTTLIKTFHKPVPVPTQRQWWRSWLRSWWWWWCYTTTTTIPLLLLFLVPTITIIYIYTLLKTFPADSFHSYHLPHMAVASLGCSTCWGHPSLERPLPQSYPVNCYPALKRPRRQLRRRNRWD